jgi:hypothetical protein
MLSHAGNTGNCGHPAALLKRGGVSFDLPREHIGGNLELGFYQFAQHIAAGMVELVTGFAHLPQKLSH